MMKKWICTAMAVLLLLLAGCTPVAEQPDTQDGTRGTTGTTEVTGTGTGDAESIFDDDPKLDDKKPVAGQDQPQDTTEEDTENSATTENNDPTDGDNTQLPQPGKMTYEEFIALSPAQQRAYQESFGDDEAGLDAFFDWYNAEKSRYEKENPPIDIGNGGIVDLG